MASRLSPRTSRAKRQAAPVQARTAGVAHSPSSQDVTHRLTVIADKWPDYVSVRTVLNTAEGRPIEAATVTDRSTDDTDKQHVLIVAGQHGNEESARLVALKLIDYLLSADGRPLTRRQKFVVMPNISPDAAERDSYETPAGIRPNLDHALSGAISPEGRAVELIGEELAPEVYVDIHARGHAGCSHDMVLFPPSRPYTEDEHLLHQIASQMAAEGERSGIPHVVHPLTWPGWGGHDLDQPSSTLHMYRKYKSLVFLTENAEHNEVAYPAKMRALSGVNRLKPLLAMGNRRYPRLYYPGYPVCPAVGMFNAGAVAVGRTAAARRASRIEIWRNAAGFEKLAPQLPEPPRAKTLQVQYTGPTIKSGIGFQVRVAGKWHVKDVLVNSRRLKPREIDGYYSWQDKHTTYAVASLPEFPAGKHEIAFTFQ
jgi:hypothetical protein